MTNNSPTPSQHGNVKRDVIRLQPEGNQITPQITNLSQHGGEERELISELRELLSDAISMVASGFHKRRLNLRLIAIEDKARLKAESHPLPAPKNELVKLLIEVRECCLFAEDEGVGVTTEAHIPEDLFSRICDVINAKPLPAPVEEGQTKTWKERGFMTSNESILKTLKAARQTIGAANSYTIMVASDANGAYTNPCNPEAVKWGLDGALLKETKGTNIVGFVDAVHALYPTIHQDCPIAVYVRNHTHDDVLAALDEAIAKLSSPTEEAGTEKS